MSRDWHKQNSKRKDQIGLKKSTVELCPSTNKEEAEIVLVLLVHVDNFIIFVFKINNGEIFSGKASSKYWTLKEVTYENHLIMIIIYDWANVIMVHQIFEVNKSVDDLKIIGHRKLETPIAPRQLTDIGKDIDSNAESLIKKKNQFDLMLEN